MGSPAFGQRRMKGVRADQKQPHDQDPCVADDRNDEPRDECIASIRSYPPADWYPVLTPTRIH